MDRDRYTPVVAVWRFREDDLHVAQLRQLGVPICFSSDRTRGLGKLQWLRGLVRRLQPEVVHSYSFYTNFAAYYASLGIKTTAVGSVRSDFARAIAESGTGLGKLCARWPRAQIFNSFTAAENARSLRGPFRPSKVLVVRNALDIERFATTPIPTDARAVIVAVGSLSSVKRWDRLLVAAHWLRQKGLDFVVKIAGEGPLRGALEAQARQLGVRECVDFIGHTDDIPALLAQSKVLVHTSDSEGCPNAVMEAMACGRPVVATDAGDTSSLVENAKTGYVVKREDSAALSSRIGSLLENHMLLQRLGEAGRAKAEREFGLDRFIEETFFAYKAAGWKDY